MKNPFKHHLILAAGLVLASSGWQIAHAQREAISRDDRRSQRQTQMQSMTPEQRLEYFNNRFNERLKSASPEQRQQMIDMRAQVEQKMQEAGISATDPDVLQKMQQAGIFNDLANQIGGNQNGRDNNGRGNRGSRTERAAADAMKQMMEAAGITDFDTQDAIIAYVNEQNKARATLLELAKATGTALQAPSIAPSNVADTGLEETADARVAKTFNAYETAVQAENERQEKALKELDEKIHYSTTPRIKAFLTLVGILNNDVLAIGGPTAVFTTPRQNRGWQTGADNQDQGNWNRGRGRERG